LTYDKEINGLRRKIENIDREIIIKIFELSHGFKHLELESEYDYGLQLLNWGNIDNIARDKNLDSKRVSEVFKEIRKLIEKQGVKY
jgi:hypothetical protein